MTLTWPSPAKLNLFLYITGRRSDGYHELQTLFQFLDYGDEITITTRQDNQLRLITEMPGIEPQNNLILKAAQALQQYCLQHCPQAAPFGADISIKKILPMGGGIGGGSSNAATVLIGLNYHWNTQLSDELLAEMGKQLGADVPVFVKGQAAFAEGIGEILTPATPEEKWYLVAHPGIEIPTPTIFTDPELNRNSPKRPLAALLLAPYANDCELIARKRFREVEQLVSWLLQYAPSRLTGTGACIFSEFKTETEAVKVYNEAPPWVQGFIARGVNESPLHRFRAGITRVLNQ